MSLLKLRLIPVVTLAAAALLLLKVSGLAIDRGYALIASRTAQAQGMAMPPVVDLDTRKPATTAPATTTAASTRGDRKPPSWAQENLGYPDTTGSVAAPPKPAENAPADGKPPAATAAKPPEPQGPPPGAIDLTKPAMTAGERAVLESLVQRRQELEARAREIEVRENLLKASEQRIEARLVELQEAEAKLNGTIRKRDEAEITKFKNLVSMYENMKPKEAAKVFDRLELRILVEVVNMMNPRRMSDILALMSADAAEKLTIEIANRSGPDRAPAASELPRIDTKPKG
jgi:flagellar motility protein MotE (MotC chaperone)